MRKTIALLALASAWTAGAVPLRWPESNVVGNPTLKDTQGRRIADGRFRQDVEGESITVDATYRLVNGDEVQEEASLSTANGQLEQKTWSWERRSRGTAIERYTVDFSTGTARSMRMKNGKPEESTAQLGATPGKTFSGIGFEYAVRQLSGSLRTGQRSELEAIAFTPTPRRAKVGITLAGQDTVATGKDQVLADHFIIRPMVAGVVRWAANVQDNHLWFTATRPPTFLKGRVDMMSLGMVQAYAYGGRAPQARTPQGR